ncbi:hypothetical protein [Leifsonia shinshuensis]|uniref:Uncharacterized protein n=1 Tax=Leifsonia shinshuensis TaxID=150026 RepID=A0A853CXN5_9MICO|nr:hypothetical protein [Leifsonia shinshuensis]NYJ23315.1 hypothetical protein [Leifsonia shinshuensis]
MSAAILPIGRPSPVPHVETIPGSGEGESKTISVRCWCPIGHDHTYAEWVELFGRSQYDAR